MKNPIRSLALGIALFGAASAAMAQSSTLTYNATPTLLSGSNTNFSFTMFDSGLGTLTAVDLLFNSSTAGGYVTLLAGSAPVGSFNGLNGYIRTTGTGMATTNSTSTSFTLTPSLPYTPAEDESQNFTFNPGQSYISSTQTYSIGSGSWASYQNAGGTGNTPNFTGRVFLSSVLSVGAGDFAVTTSGGIANASSSYTLRYTYTPSGPVPVPEPGQVAASLLLLGGIGAYYFVKRRRKSAPAAA